MIRKTIAVTAALATAAPAFAGSLALGPVNFAPSYKFQTSYEDNIYRVPRDQNGYAVEGGGVRGSWIFDNVLGLRTDAALAENQKLDLGYSADFQNYTTQPRANNATNQNADGAWSYQGSRTKARVHDEYANTQDPAFNPNGTVVNGALVQRERRWQNNAAAEAEYYLGDKFFAGVDGGDEVDRYLDRAGGATSLANVLDKSVVTFGGKAGYQVAPKTRVFVAGHRVLTHYTEHTRLDNHRDWLGDAGVEGDLTAKLTGLVQTGFAYERFDFDPGNANRQRDSRHWSVLARLKYTPTVRDTVTLAANRATVDSYDLGSRYYVTGGANLAVDHKFGEKITAGLNGGWQVDRYSDNFTFGTETKTRRDDNYMGGAHVDYQVQDWLSTGVTFTHNSRFSTFSRQFNYKDDITGWNFKLMF